MSCDGKECQKQLGLFLEEPAVTEFTHADSNLLMPANAPDSNITRMANMEPSKIPAGLSSVLDDRMIRGIQSDLNVSDETLSKLLVGRTWHQLLEELSTTPLANLRTKFDGILTRTDLAILLGFGMCVAVCRVVIPCWLSHVVLVTIQQTSFSNIKPPLPRHHRGRRSSSPTIPRIGTRLKAA